MTSPDVNAMWGQITGAPGAGPYVLRNPLPGEGFPQAPKVYTPPSPMPDLNAPDYGKIFAAVGKTGFGIGSAGREIGAYRSERALGKAAKTIAGREAFQRTQAGLKTASRARAVTGAQGRTGAGSPLLAELASIQEAQTDARNRLYQGEIEDYQARERAKKHLYKGGGDILAALLAGSSLFKEKV